MPACRASRSSAAQGLHDVVLDPDFARNRLLYLTYFAPPRGEAPGLWPLEYFYERVWTKSLAERRTMNIGMERVARARLSEDDRSLQDVEVILDGGGERRIVLAPDGTLLVTGADRFRFYDSDLDGVEHDFTDNPDIRRNFSGRVVRINRDGSIPKDNPWLGRATVLPETYAHGLRDPGGCRDQSRDRRIMGRRSRPPGRRRDQHREARPRLRVAGRILRARSTTRGAPTAGKTCRSAMANRQ